MCALRMEAGVRSPESRQPATQAKAAVVASPTRRQKPAARSGAASPVQEDPDRTPPSIADGAAQDATTRHARTRRAEEQAAAARSTAVPPTGAMGAASATWGPPDRILIEIAPLIAGGFIGQRYDLEI